MVLSNKDSMFISHAIDAANKSNMKSRHGACLAISGKYMGVAENSVMNSKKHDWSMHAEINVLKRCQLKGMQPH